MRRVDASTLRAAWWALRAQRSAARQLRSRPVTDVALPPVPDLPPHAILGVASVLRRTQATCLPRSLVRQAWHSSQGRPRDLVVGVTRPSDGFRAHAWLEGDPPTESEGFTEVLRRPAT